MNEIFKRFAAAKETADKIASEIENMADDQLIAFREEWTNSCLAIEDIPHSTQYACRAMLFCDYVRADVDGTVDLMDRGHGGDSDTCSGHMVLDELIINGDLVGYCDKVRQELLQHVLNKLSKE